MADPKFLENLNISGVGALVVSDANAVKGAGISAATSVQNNDTTVPTGKAVTTELNKKQNTLTAGTGLAFGTGADANKLGHSNSVTAKSTSSLKKFTYDAQGHVTGSSELSTAESDALASGIDSTKVAQIETNKNNILFTATIGECESTGNTANKVVTVSDVNYTPHKGSIIAVKFKYGNNVTDTAEHPITLNVNNTGAYRIWYKNGDYANASQGKIFGLSGYYIYYMYDGVDRWVWINYCMDNTYSLMPQAEASAGTATNERLINAKVLSDTIDKKLVPVENNILLITPTVNYSGDAFTVGTDYTLCDACTLTIPAPANGQSIRVANILASLTFNNSAPRGIILSTSNRATDYDNNLNLLAKIESIDYVFLSAQCVFLNYRNTTANVYVWVKSSSSAINRVISSMQLMN